MFLSHQDEEKILKRLAFAAQQQFSANCAAGVSFYVDPHRNCCPFFVLIGKGEIGDFFALPTPLLG